MFTKKLLESMQTFNILAGNSTDEIVHEKKIVIGELDYSVPLTMSNNDVIAVLSHLIEYAVYRNEYKKSLSSK